MSPKHPGRKPGLIKRRGGPGEGRPCSPHRKNSRSVLVSVCLEVCSRACLACTGWVRKSSRQVFKANVQLRRVFGNLVGGKSNAPACCRSAPRGENLSLGGAA